VLRKIFGPQRDEVKREWKRLHNQVLYDLYLDTPLHVDAVTDVSKLP
jgi:hypothetical protein